MHDYIVALLGGIVGLACWLVKRLLSRHLDRMEALEAENIELKLRLLHLEDVLVDRGKGHK